jgi:hypothetical protein
MRRALPKITIQMAMRAEAFSFEERLSIVA